MNTSRLSISTKTGLKIFKEDQILYAISEGNYSTIYLTDNQRFTTSKKLKDLSSILSDDNFFRIHHSHLINLNHLLEHRNGNQNFVVMRDGKQLSVSKRKTPGFLKLFRKI